LNCDPHHFPHEYGNPYYFIFDNVKILVERLLSKEMSLQFLNELLFPLVNPQNNLKEILTAIIKMERLKSPAN